MLSTDKFDKPARNGKKWTDTDHYKLLALTATKASIEDVASELGRTVGAVKSRLLKETYTSLSQGDSTAEELAIRYKLSTSEILRYQERQEYNKMNSPEKRTTRSETRQNNENLGLSLDKKDRGGSLNFNESNLIKNDNERSFSSVTRTQPLPILPSTRTQPLPILSSKIPLSKNSNIKNFYTEKEIYDEKALGLLTEIRDLLRIIADKK